MIEQIRVERDTQRGIARIVLDRPDQRNALNAALVAALTAQIARLDDDDGIRVVDFSNPSEPREIAAFVPEGPSSFWGVYPHRNLVLGSDWLGGDLYILKMR